MGVFERWTMLREPTFGCFLQLQLQNETRNSPRATLSFSFSQTNSLLHLRSDRILIGVFIRAAAAASQRAGVRSRAAYLQERRHAHAECMLCSDSFNLG